MKAGFRWIPACHTVGQRKANGSRYFRREIKRWIYSACFAPIIFVSPTKVQKISTRIFWLGQSMISAVMWKTDRFGSGQCADPSVRKVHRADGEMDGAGFIYFLFTEVFAPSEHCGNLLAKSQIRMAQIRRLRHVWQVQKEDQSYFYRHWLGIQNRFQPNVSLI